MAVAEIPTRNERQAYHLLRGAFIAAPIAAGFDKFTDKLGNWDRYLSDGLAERLPMRRHTFMKTVGAIEMAAGVLVAIKPKWGAPIVSAWLGGIVANMMLKPRYRDIALRDLGLAVGALALSRLANDMSRERAYREAA
ncbi:MAG TPA: hypothetical protein VIC33_13420 [Vicinamibacterales bacterium]|jgi:hypothetical protein